MTKSTVASQRGLGVAAIWLGLATIAELSIILAVGNSRGPTWLFEQAAVFLDVVMLPSSGLLGYLLANKHGRMIGWLFWANALAIVAVTGFVLIAGGGLGANVLFVCDVFWLNLYVFTLTRHWELLRGGL